MATAHLRYRYEPEGWWAESPEYPGFSAFGASLDEVRLLADEGLRFFAEDDSLEIVEPISELLTAVAVSASVGVDPGEAGIPLLYMTGSPLREYVEPDESRSEEPLTAV